MTKKNIIYPIIFVVVLISILMVLKIVFVKSPCNLAKPEHKALENEGKKYSVIIQKYNPPFTFNKLLDSEEKIDRTTPEGVYLGICSTANKNVFFSLLDKNSQEEWLELDKKSGGKLFSDDKKKTADFQKSNFKFLYKVTFAIDGKQYAIIYGRDTSKGKEYAPCTMTFVKEADGWKQTSSLRDPISGLVGRNSYEDFKKLTK